MKGFGGPRMTPSCHHDRKIILDFNPIILYIIDGAENRSVHQVHEDLSTGTPQKVATEVRVMQEV